MHRITGIGLSIGTLLLAGWLIALASGPDCYAAYSQQLHAWYGQLLLLAWSWALLYHLCNGIRHLVWDTGRALDIPTAYKAGYLTVAASLILTAAAWAVACCVH